MLCTYPRCKWRQPRNSDEKFPRPPPCACGAGSVPQPVYGFYLGINELSDINLSSTPFIQRGQDQESLLLMSYVQGMEAAVPVTKKVTLRIQSSSLLLAFVSTGSFSFRHLAFLESFFRTRSWHRYCISGILSSLSSKYLK